MENLGNSALVNPFEKECDFGNEVLKVALQMKDEEFVDNTMIDMINEDASECSKYPGEDYVPQAFTNQVIAKYLDAKLGKAIPKINVDKSYFKFYKDSTLSVGCRIVHKKIEGSGNFEVYFRSKCGRFFDSRSELNSFVVNCEEAARREDNKRLINKKISCGESLTAKSKEFAENLYKRNDEVKVGNFVVKDDGGSSTMK